MVLDYARSYFTHCYDFHSVDLHNEGRSAGEAHLLEFALADKQHRHDMLVPLPSFLT